jgi:hypothetical protein
MVVLRLFFTWLIVFHWRLLRSRQEQWLAPSNMAMELVLSNVVEELSEVICSHVLDTNMLKLYIAIANLILDVVIVDANLFCTLMVMLSVYEVNGWLVVTLQLNWASIFA